MSDENGIPQISVIIPVYNVAHYLPRCLNSVLFQSFQDIEVILIDDGSTDGGGEICDEYASKDKRIKVIHKTNQGLSAARNDGIIASIAPYIMFVDADDWVTPEFCEIPYQTSIVNKADLVFFCYFCTDNNGIPVQKEVNIATGLLSKEQAFYFNIHYTPAVWLGLYRRELFNEVLYPVGKMYEEVATTHRLIHQADRIYLVNKPLYYYRYNRPGSITTAPETKEHPDLREMSVRRTNDLYNWGYRSFAQELAIALLVKYGQEKSLIEIAKDGHACGLSWKRKVMLTILRISPALFDTICIFTGRRMKL